MKKLSLAICYIFASVLVFAQNSFTGKVTDAQNNEPVHAATVEIENVGNFVTDDKGVFRAGGLTSSHKLKISSAGFKTLESTITRADQSADFRLQRYNLLLQPVEIRAVRAGDKAPFTKTSIGSREIINKNLGQDLPFLLDQTPSVVVTSDAGTGIGYTGIRIRGSDPTRINVTLNGIPYNDAESQGTFFVDLPDFASSVNSIQVQRGVGTSSNGGGAFGATINIGTNEFREQPYLEINNGFGSFNTWKNTVKAGSGLVNDHFTFDARISRISSDGYIDRASSKLRSVYLSAAFINKRSSVRLNVFSGKEKTYQAWNGILQSDLSINRKYNSAGTEKPGSPYDNETDNYRQDNYQLFFNHQLNDKIIFTSAVFLTRGKGYYEQYKAKKPLSDYGLPDIISPGDTVREADLVQQLWLDNYFYGTIFSLQYRKGSTNITLGGGLNRYDAGHYGKLAWAQVTLPEDYKWYDLDALKTDVNIYLKLQQTLAKNFVGFLDLQFRKVNYNINGFRNNPAITVQNRYQFFNPKIGINYNKNAWNAYLSYSVGHKEPNRDDFEAGSIQQPGPESLHDFELGLEKKANLFSWGATLYYMLYRNQLVLTGKINDVGAYTRTNIPRSYRTGIELQGRVKLTRWAYLDGNLTVSKNKVMHFTEYVDDYDNGGQKAYSYLKTDISFSPGIIAGASLFLAPLKNSELSFPGKYVGKQYLDNTGNNQRSLGDFYVQNVRMIYNLHFKNIKEVKLLFQVNNLFNRMYEPNGYTFSYLSAGNLKTENYVFPMAGINWMLGVNVSL